MNPFLGEAKGQLRGEPTIETTCSLEELARELRERYPGVPLAALGQTVLWDEPMKAALRVALDREYPDARLWLGVLDTDYFAKAGVRSVESAAFEILSHNDASTKDLWVAAGELSCLFGSETVLARSLVTGCGVQMEKVARMAPEGRRAFLDRVTEAWGWRGLVYTGSRRLLARDVSLGSVLPRLIEQLRWGFSETVEALADPARRLEAGQTAESLLRDVKDFAVANPRATLTHLYQFLFPRLFERLMQAPLRSTHVGCSSGFYQFDRETAGRPRFAIVGLFLQPDSWEAARSAYNDAVQGSEIYGLDRFGPGAIPFDLIVPGRGRGTVRVLPDRVVVETDEPVILPVDRNVESVRDLAEVVDRQFGPGCVLVGKAVTQIAMLGREHLIVFSETGSGYVSRTRRMVETLARQGYRAPLFPIIRIVYNTWDSAGAAGTPLRLPPHLATALGQGTVDSQEFAARWREAARAQRSLLQLLCRTRSPGDLMALWAQRQPGAWEPLAAEFSAAQRRLMGLRHSLIAFEARVAELRRQLRERKAALERLAREQGDDYRATLAPLREQAWRLRSAGQAAAPETMAVQAEIARHQHRREGFADRRQALLDSIRDLERDLQAVRAEREALVRSAEVIDARRRRMEIDYQAQTEKLGLVRDALTASRGMERTDFRPSAWWLLLVSPDGAWFREIVDRARAYLEPVSPSEPCRCERECAGVGPGH